MSTKEEKERNEKKQFFGFYQNYFGYEPEALENIRPQSNGEPDLECKHNEK